MSIKKIKSINELNYNYEDSKELSNLVGELEDIEGKLHYSLNNDNDAEEVHRVLKPFIEKLKSFIDGRE